MQFIKKPFDALSLNELYALLRLRAEVFVLEQQCFYQDLDQLDSHAWHLWYTDENQIPLAYARVLQIDIPYPGYISIGRVVTNQSSRKSGLGRKIMQDALELSTDQFPGIPIKIMAQSYLESFYQSFGFVTKSEEFLEDGIPHIYMILEKEV